MHAYARWVGYWNKQIAKFSIYEVKVAEASAMAFALFLAKMFPCILGIHAAWFVLVCLACSLWLWYVILFRNSRS